MLDVKGQSHAEILVARRSSPAGLRTVWDAGGKTWLRLSASEVVGVIRRH